MLDSSAEAFQNGERLTEATDSQPGASLVGTVLAGRYRIERLLGAGGMGSVYRAEHVLMRKACAVKVLHREMTQVKEVVARFEREAVAAARIEHPNVAAATDFGQLENGSFYLVLEFIEGKSLNQLIHDSGGSLPEERALLITRQIGDALAAAHGAGIIHRDLKPDNVMLVAKDGSADFVKVLDFGIAKVKLEGDPEVSQPALTRLNTVMGTPEYMAPEQARGEPVDHRADLYTLGILLYEMLCGTSPYRHEEFVVVLTKKLTEDPPPLPEHISTTTRELVDRLLQRTSADRLQSAGEVVRSIDAILGYSPAPASVAFAPLSGQSAPKPSPSPEVAYANTVMGDELAVTEEKPWIRKTKQIAVQGLELAKRRIEIRGKQVPLGAIGGVLVALPVLLALLLSAGSSVSGGAAGAASVSPALVVPDDEDLATLMEHAEGGDRTALAELLGRADSAKSIPAYRALGRGYFKIGQIDAGLRAYRSGGKLEPRLGESAVVLADVRRATSDAPNQQLALEVATELGAGGADLLYELWESNKTTNAALSKQAKTLLESEAVSKNASAALKVALELPKAKQEGCQAVKELLPRVLESGDARSVPTLTKLADRRGCGFLGLRDCFGCLRSAKGKGLADAKKAASERPAPKVGG
ncbi:MAG TPA: protein kinase [Polyangiaceae bacterium]|nr:protein kinase [Polyangiaceae bacterium]